MIKRKPLKLIKVALAKKGEIAKLVDTCYNDENPLIPMSMSIGVATSQDVEKENAYDI